MYLILGGYNGDPLLSTEIYNIDSDTMTLGDDLDFAAYSKCGVVSMSRSQIYHVGGKGPSSFYDITQVFDMTTRTFSTLSGQMKAPRVGIACTILDKEGILVAAGGLTIGWKKVDYVEILDLNSETWSSVGAMPLATNKMMAAEEFLFVWDFTAFYQYEQTSDQWLEIKGVPFDLSKLQKNFIPVDAVVATVCQ